MAISLKNLELFSPIYSQCNELFAETAIFLNSLGRWVNLQDGRIDLLTSESLNP